ncbi:acetyl/propionyl-CoA carboxylase subuit alpha [Streptomyces agglomeratus]|uniref:Biotin-dependent 3-methylcrotonyl-coenzyme A carboxylase alpha1 subunit n=1 Tax=Streptomyces agglomeratus TaxID=285458 RepID=A0A1E5PJ87_9ACTN|nr:biotin carboxylase N-terminal domain-containing protein [Streptomyces agglomeratus]OEJ29621.1 acetyl/propionyl-CoA carboxylase subuit alpha [Streptomyces agglomeratus]OEJ42361.1 acetyl/propionyl-CoA carboxylase subuit alpha [Streptomyces agglomeratus]OEJ49131.1 acetyl/propionyl-CoA carboxylase subuit alpha [Streptomyces agglomeratus]
MFDTVLVANRGEIAVRVIRTLRELGVRSVAVFSDADADARHVREADTAVRIGPAAASESYLRTDRLLEAAARTGAQAVHPGYGFLAENAAFAQACTDAGLAFIGPPSSAIALMGDKIRAKETVRAAGVPVVPGSSGSGLSDAELAAAAREIGMPVLLKPSAGGGGKGMRLTRVESALADEIAAARREARASFGDDTLLVERWIDRPRHIEIQVLADAHGNVVHLGERECSLQRRHQKIIEEAPSVLLDEATRAAMGEAAVQAARSCGYRGAGTVEFIVPGNDPSSYYFMEMNTRLQVEHPVTELITGLDLVEWQLRVAAGEELPFTQKDITLTGHAVEARICAEDPSRGFLPSGGTVLTLREPQGDGVRTDSGLTEGTEVGSLYDPMLSKVIAYAPDRATALRRLRAALADTVTLGVPTNAGFLRRLLAHPDVLSGALDTGLVERDADSLVMAGIPPEVYATAALLRARGTTPPPAGAAQWADPFSAGTGWRLGGSPAWTVHHARVPGHDPVEIRLRTTAAGQEVLLPEASPASPDLATAIPLETVAPDGGTRPAAGDTTSARGADAVSRPVGGGAELPPRGPGGLPPVAADPQPGTGGTGEDERLPVRARVVTADADTVTVELAGVTHTFSHASGPEGSWLGRDGDAWHVQVHDPVEAGLTGAGRSGVDTLAAPMPGTVTVVKVAVGDHVDAGQSLLVVEAMKMEHVISAPHAGTVTELDVTPGSTVAMDQVLAVVTPLEES